MNCSTQIRAVTWVIVQEIYLNQKEHDVQKKIYDVEIINFADRNEL
jgi:hypothetical protein